MLTERELERFARQIMIFGEEGQEKLKRAKVFIAGAGGLGSPVSIYLAAAGVGRIRIVDNDVVELSNLNRQILHWEKDVGRKKVESGREKLEATNPDTLVEALHVTIDENSVSRLVGDSDLIVDAMDNFPVRYMLNRTALSKGIAFFHGGIYGFEGQVTTIIPGKTPCLRCIFPEAPPRETFPVIGVTPGIIGLIQATEVIKYITGIGELLLGKLLLWDGLDSWIEKVSVKKNPDCMDCGQGDLK
ncbi:adenylyltransferase [Methanosarcinales archaeon]|nr:MAG: adenylyltransferase [Methanosarcinales archaeon]